MREQRLTARVPEIAQCLSGPTGNKRWVGELGLLAKWPRKIRDAKAGERELVRISIVVVEEQPADAEYHLVGHRRVDNVSQVHRSRPAEVCSNNVRRQLVRRRPPPYSFGLIGAFVLSR